MADKKEIEKFCNKAKRYKDQNGNVQYISFGADTVDVMNNLFKAENFNHPDGYYYDEIGKTVYIYEHFEFDCSYETHKGSKLRRNSATVDIDEQRKIDACEDSIEIVSCVAQCNPVNNTFVVGADGDKFRDNYIENFTNHFNEHYKELEGYKKDCIEKIGVTPEKFVVSFVIEDITLFGTRFSNGKRGIGDPVHPFITKQVLETLKSSDVDFIIYNSTNLPCLSILSNNYISDDVLLKSIDLKTREFYILPAGIKITEFGKTTI